MNEMTRENAREIEVRAGEDIDNVVKRLLEYRERGESVFCNFNGHKLYSCNVTLDGAYIEIIGMTKAEADKVEEDWIRRRQEKKAAVQAQKPFWIEKGATLMYPERIESWKEWVDKNVEWSYSGEYIDLALALMEKLESESTIEQAKEMLEQAGIDRGYVRDDIRHLVLRLSKRGPEFFESTALEKLSDEDKKAIDETRRENSVLEKMHTSGDITSALLDGMSITESRLTLEDIQTILTKEQYQELVETERSQLEKRCAELNLDQISQEEIQQIIEEEIKSKVFTIESDKDGVFRVREFRHDALTSPINSGELDERKLATVVERAMQKHLDYGRFHSNGNLTADQIPEVLQFYIKIAKQCQEKNKGQTPLQKYDNELAAAEAETSAISAEEASIGIMQEDNNRGE